MTTTVHGGACSTFAEGYTWTGKAFESVFEYGIISITGDTLLDISDMLMPEYIKLDVDGIEHLILSGMPKILAAPQLKSILVETTDAFAEQNFLIRSILENAGFHLCENDGDKARYAPGDGQRTDNWIWRR